MRGISKETLERKLATSKQASKSIRLLLESLINECKELAPWQPIEDAPKDRYIRVFAPAYDDLPSLQQVCKWHESAGFCVDKFRTPTHYKELDDEPKGF